MSEISSRVLPPAERTASVVRSNWLREPLLHFLLLGGVLFAVDHFVQARQDDPHLIRFDAAADQQARELFAASRGREPTADEHAALRQIWLDNEVLYREGLAMQVDRGDDAIRERVIFKALSLVDANVKLPEADEATLRAWFEAHRDKYDEPARFDFQEAVISGDTSEDAVRRFVATLNGANSGDTGAALRVFRGRPLSNLTLSYGEGFAEELAKSNPNEWRAYDTREGWRAIRLIDTAPAKAADFAPLAAVVFQDWKDAIGQEQRSAAVRELTKKYRVVDDAAATK